MENKSHELIIAIECAKQVGLILKEHFETDLDHEIKDDTSIVTIADKQAEEIIKSVLEKEFPLYSFFGEESGLTDNKSNYLWHVDPLDGTRNFANGIPIFAVSIALEHRGEVVMGVVYNPITDSLFYAEKGTGAYLNGKQVHVSKQDKKSAMLTAGASQKDTDQALIRTIMDTFPKRVVRSMRYLGCTALELCYLARGGTEVVIEIGLGTYDIDEGTIIVQEAV